MKPQDIVVLLKIAIQRGKPFLQKDLADQLSISHSEFSESLNRSVYAGLLMPDKQLVMSIGLFEFLKSGLRYVFPATLGKITKGIPTAHSAPPLNKTIVSDKDVYVWASAKGDKMGQTIDPLYSAVPQAVSIDHELYELLAFIDGLRVGRAREKQLAAQLLEAKLMGYASKQQ